MKDKRFAPIDLAIAGVMCFLLGILFTVFYSEALLNAHEQQQQNVSDNR